MNLKEKIEKIKEIEAKQEELKKAYYDADRNKNTEEKKKIDKEIRKFEKEIDKINDAYKKDRDNRKIDEKISENATDFLNRGNNITASIEEYTNGLNAKEISDEEKAEIQGNIDKLNEDNLKLKSEIYEKAMEKSGLSWNGDTIYPTEEIKKERERLASLEEQVKELETQREKQKEIVETNKDRMNEQFNVAIEKYQEMLAAGKITQELYESRIENMMYAKEKDTERLDSTIGELDTRINDMNKEISELKGKISDLEEKEKIFDEYNNVYYELFGETLDGFYIANKEKIENNKEKNTDVNEEKKEINENVDDKEDKTARKTNTPEKVTADQNKEQEVYTNDVSEPENVKEEEETKIVVTSKTAFNELYKKLNKGTITDKELNALTEVLSDKDNYDKYGITTGMIFNKARKILKAQSGQTFKNIEKFLRNSNTFSDDIKFDTAIEKEDDVCSHDILNHWEELQEEMLFSNTSFSIEKYIDEIEKYKEAGNELNENQQRMYKEAMGIKENLASYRKALNTNGEVAMERESKTQNSVFYGMFRNKLKNSSTRALPEVKDRGVIVENNLFGRELDSMVNHDAPIGVELADEVSGSKTRDSEEIVK